MTESSRPDKWKVFSLVAIGIFMSTLDGSIVNMALPAILTEFHAPLSVVEWVMLLYLLVVTAFLLGFGRLGDLKGRKRVYGGGLVVFTAGSLFCATAGSIHLLIAARFIQGLGAAMIMACTPALVVDAFPVRERGKALGMNGAVVACGLTVGPALGGLILSVANWRMIFWINVPIGIVAAALVFRLLDESLADTPDAPGFDWPGTLSGALGIGLFLLAANHAWDWGIRSLPFATTLILASVSLACFLWHSRRCAAPVLDLELFRNRLFAYPALSGVLLFVVLFVMIFLMPFFLMLPMGLTSGEAGRMLMIPFAFLFFLSPLSGGLSDRFGSRLLCTFGMSLLTFGMLLLALLPLDASFAAIGVSLALCGIGTAIFISPNSATVMSHVPQENRGVAGAVVASARNFGMVLGIALAGGLFHPVFNRLSGGLPLSQFTPAATPAFLSAYRLAMGCGAGVSLIATLIAWMRGIEGRTRTQSP